ncbi:MAG: DUF86 domain-containing protein [Myxococcota bacterium]|jgi:uncharacterized protein with HEPN domain|nr:DUF86 domain-containing protein [Myxococcota bacterium]
MSRHDDRVCVAQMISHVEEAVALMQGRKIEELDRDRLLFLATLKLVEIVGEAANRVSDSFQTSHPEIPWREIIGTRNRLVHGYDAVDNAVLFIISTEDFPALLAALKALP